MGGLSKRLSNVRLILNKKKKSQKQNTLTLNCSVGTSTESLLARLEEAQHEQITHLTLSDSLQRPDNVHVFNALSALVTNDKSKLRQIKLVEPRVKASDYRRWSFKKTSFLRHVYQDCKDREIAIKIRGTLLLEMPEDSPQDVSSWLTTHFPKTIPQDPDLTSLWISMKDVTPADVNQSKRLSPQSDVEKVFQALIGVLNNDNRVWDFVHCHVLYTTVPKYAAPQTEALVEVAEIYEIPLQVQWQPLDDAKRAHGTWTRTTRQAEEQIPAASSSSTSTSISTTTPSGKKKMVFPSNTPRMGGRGKQAQLKAPVEDCTASTAEYEGSSGQLTY